MIPSSESNRHLVCDIIEKIDSIIMNGGRPDGLENKRDSLIEAGKWLEIRNDICKFYNIRDLRRFREGHL